VENLLLGWSFEPALALPLLGAALVWLALVRRVNRAHPDHPVPPVRSASFLGGLLAIAFALQSGIERYDTALFSIHMVQHLLLTMVGAPLIALGAPITLLLRAASPALRRRWILPGLHSRAARVVGHPILATVLFAGVMWGTHFSPLFDRALEDRLAHDVEHLAFLAAALLFWWPAVGLDPGAYRMSHPARILYTFLQMPQNTFLAVAISFAPGPLYPHYTTLARPWGPDPLVDQQIAGAIMWVGGDLLFLAAILALVAGWSHREERESATRERRDDAQLAALRAREAAFAARRASAPDSGAAEGARQGPIDAAREPHRPVARVGNAAPVRSPAPVQPPAASEAPDKSPMSGR
jgi:putative copper resistance protein D